MAGNKYDLGGRGPTNRQLFIGGVAVLLISALVTLLLLAKSTGRLEPYTRVVADLHNIGDGLPKTSDVKYHGLLVGRVNNVIPATHGKPNLVHIDLEKRWAKSIPGTVSARVIPANIFAVSSVELVDRGQGPAIKPGAHIPEDTELPTVVFQTTTNKLRDILNATARGREDKTLGFLAALGAATDSRRAKLLTAGAQMDRVLQQLNSIVTDDPTGPSTLKALLDATSGLQQTAPDLLDALHQAVRPMQVLVEQEAQMADLLDAGSHTLSTSHTALSNQNHRLTAMTSQLSPVLGVLAQTAHNWLPGFLKLNNLSDKFFKEVWIPELDQPNMRINLALATTYTYTRADCPSYGEMKGPSCFTAPLVEVRPDLPEVMLPQNYQPPPDLMPPPGTVVGENGNLVAVGPPLVNPYPNLVDPNPPLPPGTHTPYGPRGFPAEPVPLTGNPAFAPPPPGAPAPAEAAPPGPPPPPGGFPAEAAPAGYTGDPGPAAGAPEPTGQPVTTVAQLLLGPDAHGPASPADPQPSPGRP
jgi:ABC-type transporter Mla subunit MlaD